MGFKKSFFKNIATLAGYNYTTQFIEFLSTYVLSRLLLPAEYGFVALITVFTGFVSIFVDAGLSYAIIRSDYGIRYYKAISNLSMLVGCILFLIVVMLAYPISLFYKNSELIIPTIVLGSNLLIRSASIVPSAILNKKLVFGKIGLIKFIGSFIQIASSILLAYLGFSYWALILPVMAHSLFSNLAFSITAGFRFKFFPLVYLKLGFRTTKSLMAHITGFNLINYWARNIDNLIIGKFYGTSDLGIYNRAYRMLYMAMSSSSSIFGQVLFPSLKALKSKGGDVKGEFSSMLGIISIISFPIGAFLILFSKPFVRIMWGDNWMRVADLLPYFGIMIFMQTLLNPVGNIFVLYEKEKTLFRIGGISAFVMISAILAGSFFSMVHVARFYALSYIVFSVPVNLVLGFYRTLRFTVKEILIFWLPKIILAFAMLFSIWFNLYIYTVFFVTLYFTHIMYLQRKDLSKLYMLIKGKTHAFGASKE